VHDITPDEPGTLLSEEEQYVVDIYIRRAAPLQGMPLGAIGTL